MDNSGLIIRLLPMFFGGIVVGLLAKREGLNAMAWGIADALSWGIALIVLAFKNDRCPTYKALLTKTQAKDKVCLSCTTLNEP